MPILIFCQFANFGNQSLELVDKKRKQKDVDEIHQSVVVVGITEWLSCSQNLTVFEVVHFSTRKE